MVRSLGWKTTCVILWWHRSDFIETFYGSKFLSKKDKCRSFEYPLHLFKSFKSFISSTKFQSCQRFYKELSHKSLKPEVTVTASLSRSNSREINRSHYQRICCSSCWIADKAPTCAFWRFLPRSIQSFYLILIAPQK